MARFRERLSLKALLFWLGGIGALALVAVATVMGVRTYGVIETTDQVVAVYEPAAEEVALLTLANSSMERGLIRYVVGGQEADLETFVAAKTRTDLSLDALNRLLGSYPEVSPLIEDAEASRSRYLRTVARPAIELRQAGDESAAERLATSKASESSFNQLVTDTTALRDEISSTQRSGFRDLSELTGRLSRALAGSAALLMLALLGAGALLFRWVLAPLNDLSIEIRDVASSGHHHRPIAPSGPTELAAVGRDAESMRRQLVSEIDEARSAREALEQRAPIVAAIRDELSSTTDRRVPGITVHGEVHAAEGVLAGDWWDSVALPDGGMALIVTDVSGHGPRAGVVAMRLKHMLAMIMAAGWGPAEALTMAARNFSEDPSQFATLAIVCVDPSKGLVRWGNAGHPPPLLHHADGSTTELGRTGPLLSWLGGPWSASETTIRPGDLLLVYSDGLVESHDSAGGQLETAGLLALVERMRGGATSPAEIASRILAGARSRSVDWQRDDVTLAVLSVDARGEMSPPSVPIPRRTPRANQT
ncbi:MAG: PP2C family protein-serine/threonine phosphatase [Candidatus Nanopelagicales bacterium]|nr:PP2C family protein-serine/threonine phosphatase [Candidatus Nanopelagicales bacterium]